MSARGFRLIIIPAACFGGALVLLFAAVLLGEVKTCRVSETMPAADGGPDWSRWVTVPCEGEESSARVETRINPNPIDRSQVDMDRNAVDGEGVRWWARI